MQPACRFFKAGTPAKNREFFHLASQSTSNNKRYGEGYQRLRHRDRCFPYQLDIHDRRAWTVERQEAHGRLDIRRRPHHLIAGKLQGLLQGKVHSSSTTNIPHRTP